MRARIRRRCPTSCSDGNACTRDVATGSAAACSAACSHHVVTVCAPADGCCAPGCDAANDSDCSPTCGNGVREPGETCDPPSGCPASCSDGNACTVDTLTGSAAGCSAACPGQDVTACAGGDGCCPPGCDGTHDPDCGPACGDGRVEPGGAVALALAVLLRWPRREARSGPRARGVAPARG